MGGPPGSYPGIPTPLAKSPNGLGSWASYAWIATTERSRVITLGFEFPMEIVSV